MLKVQDLVVEKRSTYGSCCLVDIYLLKFRDIDVEKIKIYLLKIRDMDFEMLRYYF